LDTAGVQNAFITPLGVEVTQRKQEDKSLHFILNHNDSPQTVHLKRPYMHLLNRLQLQGDVQVAPYDVLILASSGPE
jgi:beta-galactosidase GanA